MKHFLKISILIHFFILAATGNAAELFEINKSDSNIKPLVFPLSLVVIENRPSESSYYSFNGESLSIAEALKPNLSDTRQIRTSLGAIDLARVAPSRIGKTFFGQIEKKDLQDLAKENPERILFLFRREVNLTGDRAKGSGEADANFLHSPGPSYNLNIRTRGIIYLSKQKNIGSPGKHKRGEVFFSTRKSRYRTNKFTIKKSGNIWSPRAGL